MMGRATVFWAMLIVLLIYPNDNIGGAFQPEFAAPMANLTVPLGRDAMFTCLVEHLGGYRVGWVKADTKAIQAIHEHVITHNPRVSVSRSDHSMWNLHIKGVQLEDAGMYMCQINTDPMKSQTGMLSIEVPPDFVPDETSGDVMIGEGGQVKLICRAKGVPQPRINWRREDGKDIIFRESVSILNGQKSKTTTTPEHYSEELQLTKISRHDMGAYLCIASNGVPPAISKRITINVHFAPVIHVPNQLVGAPLGTDVSLECFVEASPKSINYWMKDNEEMIITSARHDVQAIFKSTFQVRMLLNIRNLQKQDFGSYMCVAKNSLGSVDISIRLSEIPGPSRGHNTPLSPYYKDHNGNDNTVMFGSAELDKMDNKAYSVDNTVQGHVGGSSPNRASSPLPTMKINRRRPTAITNSSSANCAGVCGITFFHQCHNINLIAIVLIMIRSLTRP